MEKSALQFESPAGPALEAEGRLFTIAFVLACVTVVYNAVEGVLSVYFGAADESLSLLGFGVDSFIEVISGLGIAHMVLRIRASKASMRDQFERVALSITGFAFYALTAGLVLSSLFTVYTGRKPEDTLAGFVISAVSILSMWLLLFSKRYTGRRLGSPAILADAECTRVCIYMSLVLLAASAVYMAFRLPYVDAAGCIGLAYFSFKEGRECFEKARTGKSCCDC